MYIVSPCEGDWESFLSILSCVFYLLSCCMSLPRVVGLYGEELGGFERDCEGFLPLVFHLQVMCM
jgi:hypothetical protein